MSELTDLEARIAALETRMDAVASDSAAVRHLAAGRDRDLADLAVKVDANRSAINALGLQTAGRFDRLESEMRAGFAETSARFADTETAFTEMRSRLDQAAAGNQHIVDLLTTLIERGDDPSMS